MAFDPKIATLKTYWAEEFRVACHRCQRQVVVRRNDMLNRFGDITLLSAAQKVAAGGRCNLATGDPSQCGVSAIEVPVWFWGRLSDARQGGWGAVLYCHRKLAALKKTTSCPEAVSLDILSLITVLGEDFSLSRLPARCHCPRCGTQSINIEWYVPTGSPSPGGATKAENVLRLKPMGAIAGRKRFKVIEGG
jgi:hypothetical protein